MKAYCSKELEALRTIVRDVVRALRNAGPVCVDAVRREVNSMLPQHQRIRAYTLIRTRRGLVTKPGQAYKRAA